MDDTLLYISFSSSAGDAMEVLPNVNNGLDEDQQTETESR